MSLAMSIAMLETLTACGNGGQQAGASEETTKTAHLIILKITYVEFPSWLSG